MVEGCGLLWVYRIFVSLEGKERELIKEVNGRIFGLFVGFLSFL